MTEVLDETFSRREQTRLRRLEEIIDSGLTGIDGAFREIRDSRLYRVTHPTFEAYCRERWNLSRVHVHRLIEAAEVAALLPTGNKPPNEAQARELAPLLDQPEELREAWKEASNGHVPTAASVREIVQRKKNPDAQEVQTACYFCGKTVTIGSPQTARSVSSGWVFPRKDGGTNSISRAVYGDDFACRECVRSGSRATPLTEGDLRRSDGFVVDLRGDDGMLASVRRGEDAMRAIVMIRSHGVGNPEGLTEVTAALRWIESEAVKTVALLEKGES